MLAVKYYVIMRIDVLKLNQFSQFKIAFLKPDKLSCFHTNFMELTNYILQNNIIQPKTFLMVFVKFSITRLSGGGLLEIRYHSVQLT